MNAGSLLFAAIFLCWAAAGDFGDRDRNSLRAGTALFGAVPAVAASLHARQYVLRIETRDASRRSAGAVNSRLTLR